MCVQRGICSKTQFYNIPSCAEMYRIKLVKLVNQ